MQNRLLNPSVLLHFALFLFFVFGMVVKRADSIGVVLLLLTSLYVVFRDKEHIHFKQHSTLILIFVLYAVVGFLANIVGGHGARDYESGVRFLLAIPIVYAVSHIGVNRRVWMWIVACTGIVMGGWAIYQVFIQGIDRAGEYPIRFGDVGVLTAFLALASLFFVEHKWSFRRILQVALVLGVLGGFVASILSGTRGGWLFPIVALPLLVICFAWQSPQARKGILALMALIVAACAVLYMTPGTGIEGRVHKAVEQFQHYQPNAATSQNSVGSRLEMWRVALIAIQERPWTGWGVDGYRARMTKFVEDGQSIATIQHRHPHNEVLNDAAKRGVVSMLLMVLGLYVYPFYQFARQIRSPLGNVRYHAILGVLFISGWVVFGLTDVFLEWNQVILYYLVYISVFWSGIRNQRKG